MCLGREQALELFRSDDLIGIGMEADALRRKLHPEGVVTYTMDRCIHLANSGGEPCSFCGSYLPVHDPERNRGGVLDPEAVYGGIRATVEMGGTGVLLRGGTHPSLKLEWCESLLRGIKERFPQVHLHCFSAPEVVHLAAAGGLDLEDTLKRLRDAGLDSISGEGAGILDDGIRYKSAQSLAPWQCPTEDWLSVHRTAHRLGLQTTATMVFGMGENHEQRVHHLRRLYDLQAETGGFAAFIPWSFPPRSAGQAGGRADAAPETKEATKEATAAEYLKLLAISRLYLSNFANIQSNGAAQGLKVSQVGFRFGGNDAGPVPPAKSKGNSAGATEEELRRVIRGAGFRPVRRDTLYRSFFLN